MLGRLGVLVVVVAALGCAPKAAGRDAGAGDAGVPKSYRGPCGPDVLDCPDGRECCVAGGVNDRWVECCQSGWKCCAASEGAACFDECPTWCYPRSISCPHDQWCSYVPTGPRDFLGCLAATVGSCVTDCPPEAQCGEVGCCGPGTFCAVPVGSFFACCLPIDATDAGTDAPLDAASPDAGAD